MTPEQDALLQKAQTSLDAARLLASHFFFNDTAPTEIYTMLYTYDLHAHLSAADAAEQIARAEEFLAFAQTSLGPLKATAD